MSNVSIYPHIKETEKSEIISIQDLIDLIRSDHWAEKVLPIMEMAKAQADEKEISAAKSSLPYFTGSGVFSRRNDAGLVQHSGKLIVDFDKLSNLAETRNILIADKYSEYVFLSCTGRGLAVIVNIDPDKHLDSFLFLEKYYKTCYDLSIDKACKDLSRPRYISHDPDLFHNEHYTKVEVVQYNKSASIDSDPEKYQWCVNVHNKKNNFIEGSRHLYMVSLAFFLNKAGVAHSYALQSMLNDFLVEGKTAEEITRLVNDAYKKIDEHGTFIINKKSEDLPPEYKAKYKSIYAFAHGMNQAGRKFTEADVESMGNQHTISWDIVRNIFKSVFDNYADEFDLDNMPDIARVEVFINRRYEILKNEVTNQIECRSAGTFGKYDDINLDTIYRELQHAGNKFAMEKIKSLMKSSFVEKYNPLQTYFDTLPAWDANEEIDYINQLADHVQTDDQEFWRIMFKKALVRSIACSLICNENSPNRMIITLIGEKQETGKSSFIRFLCPPPLSDYYTESPLTGDKDSQLELSRKFIWNLEELAALNNFEINKLKAIISTNSSNLRAAYAEHAKKYPRRVNFWASTNKDNFLTDAENTRWICFRVQDINHDYNNTRTGVRNVNINNVWAQAYTLYKNKFNYALEASEREKRDIVNTLYNQSTTEKELIQKYFKPCPESAGELFSASEVIEKLMSWTDRVHKLSNVKIGQALTDLNFLSKRSKHKKGYWMREIDMKNPQSPFMEKLDFESDKKPF